MPQNEELLTMALAGYQVELEKIEARIAEVRAMLSSSPATQPTTTKRKYTKRSAVEAEREPAPKKRKRRMSKEGRARMAAAQRLRWAALKDGETTSKKTATKKRLKLSPAERARLSGGQAKTGKKNEVPF